MKNMDVLAVCDKRSSLLRHIQKKIRRLQVQANNNNTEDDFHFWNVRVSQQQNISYVYIRLLTQQARCS